MTPATVNLFSLSGQLFELLAAREEAEAKVQRAIKGPGGCSASDSGELSPLQQAEAELEAIESGIQQFVANKLREVDDLRAPLKALEQAVALNKADAEEAEGRAIVLQNRYDRLKDLIKQCMMALDQAGEWKPKETRKFESARGSFTLRGNGGSAPVIVADESLVPSGLMQMTVTLPMDAWEAAVRSMPKPVREMIEMRAKFGTPSPRLSAISAEMSTGNPVAGCRFGECGESLIVK